MIYVIGHRNPDADSIVSAIAYAAIKDAIGDEECVAARPGPVNGETAQILSRFGYAAPLFLPSVYPEVKDVAFDKPLTVKVGTPLSQVWRRLLDSRAATACVVDDDGRLKGVTTVGDVARAELNAPAQGRVYAFPMANLVAALDADVIVAGRDNFGGKVFVGDMGLDRGLDWLSPDDMVLVADRHDVQLAAIQHGVAVLLITSADRKSVAGDVVALGREMGVCVLASPRDTLACVGLLWQAVPVDRIMTSGRLIHFDIDDLVSEVREDMRSHQFKLYPVLDEDMRPAGMIGRNHLADPSRKKVILVDHNEKSQAIDGIDTATVLEVVDHHRIGSIETDHPIPFVNKPWGSTSTIVSSIARQHRVTLEPSLAGLLAAAVISDTLAFRSPTSTMQDEEEAAYLAQIAGVDLAELCSFVLDAKTQSYSAHPGEILRSDFKEFTVGKFRMGIGQATTSGRYGAELKAQLLREMHELMADAGYSLVALLLTDVVETGSEVLWAARDASLVERAFGHFGAQADAESFWLPGVVSRKQQFAPEIIRAIRESERS